MGYANPPTLQQADDLLNSMLCGLQVKTARQKPISRNSYLVRGTAWMQIDNRLVTMLHRAGKIRRETLNAEWYEWKPTRPEVARTTWLGNPADNPMKSLRKEYGL